MRRVLLLAAVSLPAFVLAAVSAGTGQVLEIDNFNATAASSYVNAAQCAGTAPVRLEWNIILTTGGFTTDGTYRIYASDTAPSTSGDNANFCPEVDSTTPVVNTGQVQSVAATLAIQGLDVSGSAIATNAAKTCDSGSEGHTVYVCSHWYDGSAVRRGYASGKFIIQLAAPNAPTGAGVEVGDTRLRVSWTPSTSGAAAADHYIAEATPVAGGAPILSSSTNGTEVTISGLTNGTEYSVVVYAFSVGGNRSVASNAVTGTPMPVDDFWEHYRNQPGAREEGGCGTGGAGAFALLGAAALLVASRRRK